ncbi:hypothetical protein ONZ45_g8903 [Pleurotus djamor]|nr:hypothetical protein ONZ45_g8903 [Pleurotus djamor]
MFRSFATFALLAITAFAATIPEINVAKIASHAQCNNPELVHNATIAVGDKLVLLTSIQCAPTTTESKLSSTPTPTPTPSAPVHVCGASCTTLCNNDAGVLPPTSEDYIFWKIFKNQGPTSFVVSPFHMETLSFGSCSYFFMNTSDHDLESCWDDLANTGDAAGAACFPPHQPFTSEGLCSSSDGQWSIGAAHA